MRTQVGQYDVVTYAVHGCDAGDECRTRPECKAPKFSGFVEGRRIARMATIGTYTSWSTAEDAGYRKAMDLMAGRS